MSGSKTVVFSQLRVQLRVSKGAALDSDHEIKVSYVVCVKLIEPI
jgi:hypothetical protein